MKSQPALLPAVLEESIAAALRAEWDEEWDHLVVPEDAIAYCIRERISPRQVASIHSRLGSIESVEWVFVFHAIHQHGTFTYHQFSAPLPDGTRGVIIQS